MSPASKISLSLVLLLAVACGREESSPQTDNAGAAPAMAEMKSALETCKNQLRQKAPLLAALVSKLTKGKGMVESDEALGDGSRGVESGQRGGACLKQLFGNVDKLKTLVQDGLVRNPEAQEMVGKLVQWVFNRKNGSQ